MLRRDSAKKHAPPTPRRPRVGGRNDWTLGPRPLVPPPTNASHHVAAIPRISRWCRFAQPPANGAVMPSASCVLAADFSRDRDHTRRPSIQSLRPPTPAVCRLNRNFGEAVYRLPTRDASAVKRRPHVALGAAGTAQGLSGREPTPPFYPA